MIHSFSSIFSPRAMHFLLFALCCAAFAACTDADDGSFMERAEVQFTSSLLGDEPAATRVYDTSWTGGEKVGVTMVSHGKAYNGEAFAQYTAASSGSSTDFAAVGTGLYYPLNPTSKVNFIAYSPYVAGATTTVQYTSMQSQSTKALMESKDFIYHKGTTAYDRTTVGKVGLGFTHKLSKLVINVERATGVSEPMKKLVVTVSDIPQSATCKLSDGSLSGVGTKTTLTPWQNNDEIITTDTKTRFEAIVAPHGAANHTVTFKVMNSSGAEVRTYTQTISDAFVSGKRHIYNFKITATGVALSGSSVSDWATHTTSNDAYYLTVADKLINVGSSGITNGTLAIETNSNSTLTVKRSNSPDKITDSGVTWLTKFALTKGSITNGVTPYTVTYSADAHTGSADRAAYLWIQVDNLTLIVKVLQSGRVALPANDANCYILAPGSKTVKIPVARAKYYSQVYDSNHPSLGANEAFTAHVLWSDQPSLVTVGSVVNGAEGSFVVTTNSGSNQGNAVVAIRNASGHILWSWHIWVTTPAPTAVAIGNESKRFMSRNLGAINETPQHQGSLGLLYQWGRKDPFTGASVFTSGNTSPAPVQIYMNGNSSIKTDHPIVAHTKNISITGSIAQPHTFFAGSGDWAPAINDQTSTGKSGLRWGPASGFTKALDDPCPAGYKVPTRTQFENGPVAVGLGTFNLGYSFNGNWWSAAGNRSSSSGSLINVGSYGYYWSAARADNSRGYNLTIRDGYVSTLNGTRSLGYSVRCVSQ